MPDWLLDEAGLAIVRRAYARQMLATANVRNDRLEQVFATIRREAFECSGFDLVRSLRWNEPAGPMGRWYGTPTWSLCYDEVGGPGKNDPEA